MGVSDLFIKVTLNCYVKDRFEIKWLQGKYEMVVV